MQTCRLKGVGILLTAGMFAWATTQGAERTSTTTPSTRPVSPTYRVGFRVFKWSYRLGDGSSRRLMTGVWYPAEPGPEKSHTYVGGLVGRAVPGAPAAKHPRGFPLIVFSHGFGGAAIQSIYLTEYLASKGYVVAAPDHNDPIALLRIERRTDADFGEFMEKVGELGRSRENFPFERYEYRPKELSFVIDRMLTESTTKNSPLDGLIDGERIGCVGHSMGGYTVLALTGCREKHTDKRIKAAVLLSPAVFMWGDTAYRRISVPVMYMYGQREGGRRRDKPFDTVRAYRNTPARRWLLEIWAGNHFTFANSSVYQRLRPSVRRGTLSAQQETIARYALAMFDKYLRQDPAAMQTLTTQDEFFSHFEFDLPKPPKGREKSNSFPPDPTIKRGRRRDPSRMK